MPIRVQLALLVLFTSLLALSVLSIATVSLANPDMARARGECTLMVGIVGEQLQLCCQYQVSLSYISEEHTYYSSAKPAHASLGLFRASLILNRSQGLSLTASLKAGQIASDLELLEATCGAIVTRISIQSALQRFYTYNNNTEENWVRAREDIQFALSSGGYSQLLQVRVYSRNGTGDPHGLLNVTADSARDILLPMFYPNSTVSILPHSRECSNKLLASDTW